MKNNQKALPLYIIIFNGFVGYALTITLFIPMLMDKNFHMLPADISVSSRAILLGLLLSMYPLGQFIGSPIIGSLSDYHGRKKILLFSLIASIAGFIGMAISIEYHLLTLLFISSFFTGLCESNMAISQSILIDSTENAAEQTKLIGYAYSACSLGYIIGPLVGGIGGASIGYSAPFWFVAMIVLLLTIWTYYCFNDNYNPDQTKPISYLQSLASFKQIFHRSVFRKTYLINFLIFFSIQGLYRVVPMYVVDEWKPSLETYSLLISYVSFLCLIANLFILGRLTEWVTPKRLLSTLLLLSGCFAILITVPHQFFWIWIIYGAVAIPTVMALPTCTTLLSQKASSDQKGKILGNNQALLVLGESSSAAVGGLIAAIFIPLPIIIMGLVLLTVGIMVIRS